MMWTIRGKKWDGSNFLEELQTENEKKYFQVIDEQLASLKTIIPGISTADFEAIGKAIAATAKKNLASRGKTERELLDGNWLAIQDLYQLALKGDMAAALSLWHSQSDEMRLHLTLHFWELFEKGKFDASVWGSILRESWSQGKIGSLLLEAKIPVAILSSMFRKADLKTLMSERGEHRKFSALPQRVAIWRGTEPTAHHKVNGLSWTLNRDYAEWFALRHHKVVSRPDRAGLLIQAEVPKTAVMAYFKTEFEIVVDPTMTETIEVKAQEQVNSDLAKLVEIRRRLGIDK